MNLETKLNKIEKRKVAIYDWLKEEFPQIADEQRHLDKGSVERYYWHYGYLMALSDLMTFLRK